VVGFNEHTDESVVSLNARNIVAKKHHVTYVIGLFIWIRQHHV
jgi:hypothetical protein